MAAKGTSYAKEDRRFGGATVDIPFLTVILLLLAVGLLMLYSASYAQSEYDTGYEIIPGICKNKRSVQVLDL